MRIEVTGSVGQLVLGDVLMHCRCRWCRRQGPRRRTRRCSHDRPACCVLSALRGRRH